MDELQPLPAAQPWLLLLLVRILLPLRLQERWPAVKEQELRNHLGSFGIKGATATQPLPTLSGAPAGLAVCLLACLSGRPFAWLDGGKTARD
jgi:hypothetical protein